MNMSDWIGPHQITVNGRATTPRAELKELYSAIEEAKADVLGLYMLQHFFDRGYMKHDENALYTTFLASSFRTLRFGLTEAHGKGMALQFNYLTDKGAFVHKGNGWEVDAAKIRGGVRDLAHDLLDSRAFFPSLFVATCLPSRAPLAEITPAAFRLRAFDFRLRGRYWLACPFCLGSLRTRPSGPRAARGSPALESRTGERRGPRRRRRAQ